jgi:dCMP deaminase
MVTLLTPNKWDMRRLALAKFVAEWSKDPKAKVGAVITDYLGRVIALGYNGFAVGIEDSEGRLNSKEKLDMILHAEENAVLIAGERARGGTIYVIGKPTCAHCASVIIQSGLKRVVSPYPNSGSKEPSKWMELGILATEIFDEASVDVNFHDEEAAG